MYRHINPRSRQQLAMRMLFEPAGNGVFLRACEADSHRGLIAAVLDDPTHEDAGEEDQLVNRLRLAKDVALWAKLVEGRELEVGYAAGDDTLNAVSDESLVHSLDRVGFVSLPPA